MKYIKLYKIFESSLGLLDDMPIDIKDLFSNHINYDLIQEMKDLSLEYIDDGYTLYYSIYVNDGKVLNNSWKLLLNAEFNHEIDKIIYNTYFNMDNNFNRLGKISIGYSVGISYKSITFNNEKDFQRKIYEEDLLRQLKNIYPNEYIDYNKNSSI
jgi:hypothetical protein